MDFLQTDRWDAARDATALLSVALDQACMDNGRFDLAHVLTLAEELPASVFTHKASGTLSQARAFSPLACQKWIIVALAYLKEFDTITAKRIEMGSTSKQGSFGNSQSEDAPKAKLQPKKKGKGGPGGPPAKTENEAA